MRAELRLIDTTDADLETFAPAEGEPFVLPLQLYVGPAGERGEESFELLVCNIPWLASQLTNFSLKLVNHTLIVDSWDYHDVERFLTRTINDIEDTSWERVAMRVGEIGLWEFYNIRERNDDQ
ncbi:Imm8 family immunity protein [Leifsonia sp. 2TAF2]|uniref:Imm8 family immunity protein n=1 Tax=Leifsonia sp. 2TAF2 TaxID=3233009 RepID=UPI003F9C0EAD